MTKYCSITYVVISGDFFKAKGKFFKKEKTYKIQKNAWNFYFNRYYDPYNLMFEDYFMQILTVTAPQMVHPLSPIMAYFFQHFSWYLTNKCFNIVFLCVN